MTRPTHRPVIAIMGIVSQNLGNRLQNYALQQALSAIAPDADVLTLRRAYESGVASPYRRLRRRLSPVKRALTSAMAPNRANCFWRFDRENVRFAGDVVAREYTGDLSQLAGRYDAFVIGSDQPWNPSFPFNSDLDYLPFVPSGKKLAYAVSFGVSKIDSRWERTAELLNGIPSISMREEAGARIVRELTGRTVPVVLDPTMLLTSSEWRAVERKPNVAAAREGGFCLKYMLGDDVNGRVVDRLAAERGLAVVDLRDHSLPVGPAEFVWLVRNAGLVCTDSFHGSVFSTLFHRPFVIFERREEGQCDMSSRLDTLCGTFGLEHHRANGSAFDLARCEDEDWGRVDAILALQRRKSVEWLSEALETALSSGPQSTNES